VTQRDVKFQLIVVHRKILRLEKVNPPRNENCGKRTNPQEELDDDTQRRVCCIQKGRNPQILAGLIFRKGNCMKTFLSALIGMSLALSALGQMQQNEETTARTVRKGAKAEEKAKAQSPATHRPMVNQGVRTRQNTNVRQKTNVGTNMKVNVHDTARFTNVTRITSSGRTFDRAVFRDRDDRHFHIGLHDRAFFVRNFSEVVVINRCSFFLDEGIFWPAFIIGETCVHPRNVVFVAVG